MNRYKIELYTLSARVVFARYERKLVNIDIAERFATDRMDKNIHGFTIIEI